MHEPQKSSSPTIPNPRLFAYSCPSQPDPTGHARALIESHGLYSALQIARSNAFLTRRREDYWSRVLLAMEERTRATCPSRESGKHF